VRSVIAGKFVDRRSIRGFLLASLVVAEIIFGSLVAMRSEDASLILGAAVGLIVVVVTFIEPVFGLYLFVATIFTEASFMLGLASATKLMGILVLGAWIAHSLLNGGFEIIVPRQGWFAIMFAVWGLFSAMWATDIQKLFTALLLLVQSIASYILIVNLVNSAKRIQIILAIIVIVSLPLALLTISHVLTGELVEGRVDLGQISVGDMNAQAAYFLPGATLLMILFSHKAQLAQKLFLLLGFSVIVLAILATSSRGAMVALLVVFVLGMTIDHKLWQVVFPVLLAGGGAMLFLPRTFVDRVESIVTLSDRGAGRLDIWPVALQIIRARPLSGVGLDNFGRAFDRYLPETPGIISNIGRGRGSHNIFLNVQSELGVIGFVLFAVCIGTTIKSGLVAVMNLRRAGDSQMAALALAVWLSLMEILVMGLFIDLQYWKLFWLLMALPEVMRRLSFEPAQEAAVR
jgi:putative inorganic carbon (HCO3(-)) transporter